MPRSRSTATAPGSSSRCRSRAPRCPSRSPTSRRGSLTLPPQGVGGALLERLLADTGRSALIVASGLADDASSALLATRGWRGERRPRAGVEAAEAFLAAFAAASVGGKDGGRLSDARLAHNAALAGSADVAAVRDALGRVLIFDRTDAAGLDATCQDALRRDHGIPSDRTAIVLLALRDFAAAARAEGADAFPVLRRILVEAAPDPTRPDGYVRREDEGELVDALSRDCALLSGTPRVGKSHAARWAAAEFRTLGHDVREFSDVERAARFLLGPGVVPRLALLDDPLGGSQASVDAARSLARLDALVGRAAPARKLLVTKGLAPLLATAGSPSLGEVRTGRGRWRDVGTPKPAFLADQWGDLASSLPVGAALRGQVADAIAAGSLAVEPGCLEHLAAYAHELPARPSLDDVVRLAREDATQLGRAMAGEGLADLAIHLSACTSPGEPIRLAELAFVRGGGGTGLPSLCRGVGTTMTFGGPPPPPRPAPAYDATPELAAPDANALDALERRRLITVDGRDRVGFAHPFYRAAAETQFAAPTLRTARGLGRAVERGLLCLSPVTSRTTARNLDWAYERLIGRPAERGAPVAHADKGLRCAFPATWDLCFRFLVRRLGELSPELRDDLPDWIASVTSVALEDPDWAAGKARLPVDGHLSRDHLERALGGVARDDVARELASLEAPDGSVTPQGAAAVLRFPVRSPEALSARSAGRLLGFDEAVLRAEAGRVWLSRPHEAVADADVLAMTFADDHPSCALAALRGAIAGWRDRDPAGRTRMLDGLGSLVRRPVAAAAMFGQLLLFDRVEHTRPRPPRGPTSKDSCRPPSLPADAALVEARLPWVVGSALEVLPASSVVAICEAWTGWLERVERAGLLADESSLSVADLLLEATADVPALRGDLATRPLSFAGTGARAAFVAALVDRWRALRPDERQAVLRLLGGGRSDDRWVQAVALTRDAIPEEVRALALPDGPDPAAAPELMVDAAPPHLFEAAVRVHVGRPSILRSLGLNHAGREVWGPVVQHVARRPEHPLFELCWWHVARGADDGRVARMVVDAGPPADRGRWLDMMAEAAPAVLRDVADAGSRLTEAGDLAGMLDRLVADRALVGLSTLLPGLVVELAGDGSRGMAIEAVETVVRSKPPRLPGTCDRLIARLDRVPDASALVAALRELRAAIHAGIVAVRRRMEPPRSSRSTG